MILGIIVVLMMGHQVRAQEEADTAREVKIHNIYQQYMSQPTPEDVWQNALQNSATQNYSVQEGDTLSDISETFFADPGFWPKIWSLNTTDILNPHEIEPDQVIYFTPGSMEEPPSLKLGPNGEPLVEENEEIAEADIPPPKVSKNKKIQPPASLPTWSYVGKIKRYQMEVTELARNFAGTDQPLTYYVDSQPLNSEGRVVQTELGANTGAENQYIFVKLKDANAKKLLVIKDLGPVEDAKIKSARVMQIQAEIEVQDLVNQKLNIYRAKIVKSYHLAEVGAELVQAEMPMMNMNLENDSGAISAKIFGGQFSVKRNLFGTDSILFINAGAKQGVAVGQSVPVFRSQKARNPNSLAEQGLRPIGKIKIVKVSEDFATAVVLQASEDIAVGDTTDSNAIESIE